MRHIPSSGSSPFNSSRPLRAGLRLSIRPDSHSKSLNSHHSLLDVHNREERAIRLFTRRRIRHMCRYSRGRSGESVICACTAGAENTTTCAPAKKHTAGSTEAASNGATAHPACISEGSQIRRDKDSTGPAPAFRTENTLFQCAGYLCSDRKKRSVFRKLRGGSGCTPCCVPERIR